MVKIVRWASLALACALSVASVVSARAQTQMAAMSENELRRECLRWFNTSYAGTLKNGTYLYRFGRRVVYQFSTAGKIVQVGRQALCEVSARWKNDVHGSGSFTLHFDGQVAIWRKENTQRVWTSFKPQGRCLWREGRMVSDGFDKPVDGNYGRDSGEGHWCPNSD